MTARAPVYAVRLLSKVDNSPSYDLDERVLSIEYEDNAKAVDKLSITLDNFDLKLFDDERWRLGAVLEVAWGYAGEMTTPRRCEIRKMSGFSQLKVEALSELLKMNSEKRRRTFENMTHSEVVEKIATEPPYRYSSPIVQDTKIKYEHVVQPSMTDAQFITWLAKKEGYRFFVDKGGTLHFHVAKYDEAPVRSLAYYAGPNSGDILDISIEHDQKNKAGKRTLEGRDPIKKEPIKEKAGNAETKRDGLAPVTDTEAKSSGFKIGVNAASGELSIAIEEKAPTTRTTKDAAKREADAQYLERTRPEVKITMTVVGDRELATHKVVLLENIGRRFSGRYYITKCVAKISRQGFTNELELERDGHNGYGSSKDVKNEVALNKKPVKKKGEPEQRVGVNGQSGETEIRWVNK